MRQNARAKRSILRQNATNEVKRSVLRQNATNEAKRSVLRQNATNKAKRSVLRQNATNEAKCSVLRQNATNKAKRSILRQNATNEAKRNQEHPFRVGGSTIGSRPKSASLSFRSNIAYNESAKTFSSSNMEKETYNFNELGVLGEGGFGRVYSGTFEDETEAAVKVLKRDDQQGGQEFLAEVKMLSRLHYRNLVRLLGIFAPLDWRARLKISLGVAQGLAYFHEDSSLRVIHRDFKSSNILLEQDFTPKVSDFGLA
ncbi:receptor-like serine/threonine-protein kinase ALE2 [Tanacetum coccineum]|uniref:Receptor-like serine/threonine-protein kinase ALE2 n=1 Tax=Tanacetum coccineum TaxID=301880 RepID=A0ABQ5CKI7_9ASTR